MACSKSSDSVRLDYRKSKFILHYLRIFVPNLYSENLAKSGYLLTVNLIVSIGILGKFMRVIIGLEGVVDDI
jgi:hypothetical protein